MNRPLKKSPDLQELTVNRQWVAGVWHLTRNPLSQPEIAPEPSKKKILRSDFPSRALQVIAVARKSSPAPAVNKNFSSRALLFP